MDDVERRECQDAAHEDLMRYRTAQRDMEHYAWIIEKLKSKIDGTIKPLSSDKIMSNNEDGSTEAIMTQIVDLQRSYGVRALRAERICAGLEIRISDWTEGIEGKLLRAFYLCNQRLKDIAAAEKYSLSYIKKLKTRALINYGKNLKESQNNS